MFPGTDNRGLSLIEIIIATFILAISSVSIYTVFRTATTVYSKAQRQLEMVQNARIILEQITRELECAVFNQGTGISLYGYETGSGIKSGSTRDEIHFVSPIPNSGDWDLCEVGYWVRGLDNTLMRCFETNPDFNFTNNTSSELGYNVTDLQFFSYYRDSSLNWIRSQNANWNSSQDIVSNYDANGIQRNPDGLPDMVEVRLTVRDDSSREQPKEFSTFIYIKNNN